MQAVHHAVRGIDPAKKSGTAISPLVRPASSDKDGRRPRSRETFHGPHEPFRRRVRRRARHARELAPRAVERLGLPPCPRIDPDRRHRRGPFTAVLGGTSDSGLADLAFTSRRRAPHDRVAHRRERHPTGSSSFTRADRLRALSRRRLAHRRAHRLLVSKSITALLAGIAVARACSIPTHRSIATCPRSPAAPMRTRRCAMCST